MVQWFLKKFWRVEFCFDDSRFTGNVKAGKEELHGVFERMPDRSKGLELCCFAGGKPWGSEKFLGGLAWALD